MNSADTLYPFFLVLSSHHRMAGQAQCSLLRPVLPADPVFLPQCPWKCLLLAESLCCAGERWRSRNQLWKVCGEGEMEDETMDKGIFMITELPTPSYSPVNQRAVKLPVGRRWHVGHKAGGTCCWGQILSSGLNDWNVFRRTGYLQLFSQCFSTWFLLLVSAGHPWATKPLTPKKARTSQKTAWRAACGHLHFLSLSSPWHQTRRAEGKGELTTSGKALRDLVRGRLLLGKQYCLSSCLIFPMVFTLLPSRGLLQELDRGAWEISRLLTTWRSRSAISSDYKTQTKVTGLALPSTSGRRRQKLQSNAVAPALVSLCSTWWKSSLWRSCPVFKPGFHAAHSGLLVQSQLFATARLQRGYSVSHRLRRCKRGDWVWGEEIWVSEGEFRVGKASDSFIDETTARC